MEGGVRGCKGKPGVATSALRCLVYHIKQTPLRSALGAVVAPLAQGTGSVRKEWGFGHRTLKPHLLSIRKPTS